MNIATKKTRLISPLRGPRARIGMAFVLSALIVFFGRVPGAPGTGQGIGTYVGNITWVSAALFVFAVRVTLLAAWVIFGLKALAAYLRKPID